MKKYSVFFEVLFAVLMFNIPTITILIDTGDFPLKIFSTTSFGLFLLFGYLYLTKENKNQMKYEKLDKNKTHANVGGPKEKNRSSLTLAIAKVLEGQMGKKENPKEPENK